MTVLKFKKFFWFFFYLLSPLIPIYFYFMDSWYALIDTYGISIFLGIFGYIYFLNQFILGSRPKFWEKIYGLDKILRFHGFMNFLAAVLITIHIELKLLYFPDYTVQMYIGVVSITIFFAVIMLTLLFMVETFVSRFTPFHSLKEFVVKKWRVQYQHLRIFHNLTSVATLLALVHVLLASSTQENSIKSIIMVLWFVFAFLFYLYHKIIKPWRLKVKPFIVTEIKKESPDIWTVMMKIPEGRKFKHQPGQFAYFKFLKGLPGKEEHPFTISSPPNQESISITVKNLGDWTGKINLIKPGDPVAVDGPYGVFSYTGIKDNRPLYFIAGGIGITPFFSMLYNLKLSKSPKEIHLIWGVRTKDDLIRLKEIENLKRDLPKFSLTPVVSRDKAWEGNKGRINKEILHHAGIDKKNFTGEFYICGPFKMMKDTVRNLKELGVKSSFIHMERFNM
jgi:predicted ferric reductase